MAQRHYLQLAGGSTIEVTSRVENIEGWTLTERAEEGAPGSGTIWLKDPDEDLEVDGLRSYHVLEDASEATDNVLFAGFAVDPECSRGEQGTTHYDPIARMWQIQLTDRNGYWNRRVMVGTDNKRLAETDVARMQWLLTTSEASWLNDASTYLATGSPSNMDKNDYRGQYLNQIVDDCAQHTGKNWWVQLQETGAGRSNVGWYGLDSLTTYSSPLYLSNDPADWDEDELADGTSLVWPLGDKTKLKLGTERVYSGVYLRYDNGRKAIYRRNAAAVAVYGIRDYVADYPNVRTKAKAIARANRLLADLATPDERITTTVRLPKGKATKLRAGMRVPVKATHLTGYTSYRWMRVLSCGVSPVGIGDEYDLALELQGPGTTGPAAPYTGSVFAGILRSDNYPTLGYGYLQSAPPPGWGQHSIVGPIAIDQSVAPFTSMTVSAPMIVRILAVADWSGVVDTGATRTLYVKVNGVTVGSQTQAYGGSGLGFWTFTAVVDLRDYVLAAGDVVSVAADSNGGWTNFATDGTYLRVGRGTTTWSGGSFVGP